MSAFFKGAVLVTGVVGQDSYDAETGMDPADIPVQNQGQCGSCWSFSATEMLSQRILKTGEKHAFETWGALVSAQVPVSFPSYSGGNGCNGGWPYKVGNMVQNVKGLPGLKCAPYLSGAGCPEGQDTNHDGCNPENWGTCWGTETTTWNHWGAFKDGYITQVKQLQGEADYKEDIMSNGDLSAAFKFFKEFQLYRGGVMTQATPAQGGHAILITGWGSDGGVPYWKVRNSWSTSWGESGYCRMLRGQNFQNLESTGASFVIGTSEVFNASAPFVPPEGVDMPGGWVGGSLEDEHVVEALAALQEHLNEGRLDLLRAASQVVEGLHVKLHVRVGSRQVKALAHKPPMYRDANQLPAFKITSVDEAGDDILV